ncbi:unnamed protein product [Musa acuminata var. zebrina]
MQARRFVDLGRRLLASSRPALYPLPPECLRSVAFPVNPSSLKPVCADVLPPALRNRPPGLEFYPSSHLLLAMQARFYAAKERSRAPLTPVTSKVKKYKLKSYSTFKFRFRTMNDGQIRRWRTGKRHNAHLKSKKAKRRLRRPEIVHAAYAKVMKKLNFCA